MLTKTHNIYPLNWYNQLVQLLIIYQQNIPFLYTQKLVTVQYEEAL